MKLSQFRWTVPAQTGLEATAADRVIEALMIHTGQRPARADDIRFSTAEAIANAIEHGPHTQTEIHVALIIDTDICIQVCAGGPGPDLAPAVAVPLWKGLSLMRNLSDQISIERHSNHHILKLRFSIRHDEAFASIHTPDQPNG